MAISRTHRSRRGPKLYAVRDSLGRFKDIQVYKRLHRIDVKRKEQKMGEKLEFVTDGFGEVRRYKVTTSRGKYNLIYLAPEVCRKVEEPRQEAAVKAGGLYYLKRGDIVLR